MNTYEKDITTCLDNVNVCSIKGKPQKVVALHYDSRKVVPNSAFFALDGIHTDGKTFINDAIKKGAKVIIYEGELTQFQNDVLYISVKNIRDAMAHISSSFYDEPSSSLCVIGVTGTEGKSSTTSFIFQLLKLCKQKAGFVSTVSYSYGDETKPNPEHQTTPESTQVQEHLAKMKDKGVFYAVLESSSHGLSEKTARLKGVLFDVGVCLNITQEHLEFHKTIECYRSDKANLFRMIGEEKIHQKSSINIASFAVINEDDKHSSYLKTIIKTPVYSFTHNKEKFENTKEGNVFLIEDVKEAEFLSFSLLYFKNGMFKKLNIKTKLHGSYNADNITASIIVAFHLLNISLEELSSLIEKIDPITGRMFSINEGQDFEVIIDYAHTPSSFNAIFPTIKERIKKRGGKVISLFGSGGERDIQKREEQGRIADLYSDIIILADEDPRGEDSTELLEMIAKGINNKKRGESLFIIPKREKAIEKAFSIANKGDVVLLLGKGHENSIIFKDRVQPYNEEGTARSILKNIISADSSKTKSYIS
ncbi:MAG: UDP-N-acetylmuramoyl-L-alanyl-D-glutamate--2,6-diaminopimelate ligase [Treponema sp.]